METKWVKRSKVFSKTWFFLITLFLIIIIPFIAATIWINWGLAPLNSSGNEKVFVIKENEEIPSIAKRLKEEGFIRDSTVFSLYLKLNCLKINLGNLTKIVERIGGEKCLSNQIQAGTFKISSTMSVQTLALNLTKGRLDSWLTIKEGLRNEEIAAVVAKNFSVVEKDFLKVAKIGYMFPDTYLFKVNSTASDIAIKMRATFDEKFDAEIQAGIVKQGLSSDEGVIIASILERESKDTEERPIIAGILLKRLREGWKLEVDATIQYALGYDLGTKTWWRKSLTEDNLNINSPFNTRKNSGLPPNPISNPGLSSLKAVAAPVTTSHYYYLHGNDGNVYYGDTLEQHNHNKALHLQ